MGKGSGSMITCPKCDRPVSGRARACGYCGQSLVQDYFYREETGTNPARSSAGAIAGTTLGIFGCLALLAALIFHMLVLFGHGDPDYLPEMNLVWWVRTLLMAVLPVVLLVQLLILRGVRYSMVPDCVWLFLSVAVLMVVIQAYLDTGADRFYGMAMIPYLLVVGCVLVAFGAAAGILSYRPSA